jgi:hypothetical protein
LQKCRVLALAAAAGKIHTCEKSRRKDMGEKAEE